jgi:poly(A) polymerase
MKQYTPILKVLNDAGHQAFFVGGCVRDHLLDRPGKDVDITTSATPDQVAVLFPDSKLVGAHFGVVIVTLDGLDAEIATFRTDGCYSDTRRPDTVAFTTDVKEDLARRDFTINTLLMSSDSLVHDWTGGGADITGKSIRCMGDPYKRFAEDALRMLRAIRFAAQLGFTIEKETFEAIQKLATLVTLVSRERITQELSKILVSGRAGEGFRLLEQSGLMTYILPEIEVLSACPQNPVHHPEGDALVHTYKVLDQLPAGCSLTLALAALFHDVGKPGTLDFKEGQPTAFGHDELGAKLSDTILRRMKFSNEVVEAVVQLVDQHMRFRVIDEMRKSKLYRFLRQPNFMELLELHRIDALAGSGNLTHYDLCVEKLAEVPEEVLRPEPLITGIDLIALGLKPGPLFKIILSDVENLQLDGKLSTKEEAITAIKEFVELSKEG